MIVKNEAPVIRRCLDSLKPYVDWFVIVDTGSTDGTQEIVRQHYPNATLFGYPWVNFGVNRQQALERARESGCEYILFMDADDTLHSIQAHHSIFQNLTLAGYRLPIHYGDTHYTRCCLVRSDAPWFWNGVVHEYLDSPVALTQGDLTDPFIIVHHDGARSKDPTTYLKDIDALEEALKADPNNARNVFYLAQSYKDAGKPESAHARYRKRAGMVGWEEEGWYAEFEAAKLTEQLGCSSHETTGAYLAAFQRRPTRAEPLYYLAKYHRCKNEHHIAYLVASRGVQIPKPADALFVNASVYEWRMLEEKALSAYYVGEIGEGRLILEGLIQRNIPEADKQRMIENLRWYK